MSAAGPLGAPVKRNSVTSLHSGAPSAKKSVAGASPPTRKTGKAAGNATTLPSASAHPPSDVDGKSTSVPTAKKKAVAPRKSTTTTTTKLPPPGKALQPHPPSTPLEGKARSMESTSPGRGVTMPDLKAATARSPLTKAKSSPTVSRAAAMKAKPVVKAPATIPAPIQIKERRGSNTSLSKVAGKERRRSRTSLIGDVEVEDLDSTNPSTAVGDLKGNLMAAKSPVFPPNVLNDRRSPLIFTGRRGSEAASTHGRSGRSDNAGNRRASSSHSHRDETIEDDDEESTDEEDGSSEGSEETDEEGSDEEDDDESSDDDDHHHHRHHRHQRRNSSTTPEEGEVRLATKVSREGDRNVKVVFVSRRTSFKTYVKELMRRFGYAKPTDFDMYCIDEAGDHVDIDDEYGFKPLVGPYLDRLEKMQHEPQPSPSRTGSSAGANSYHSPARGGSKNGKGKNSRFQPQSRQRMASLTHHPSTSPEGLDFTSNAADRSSETVLRLYVRDSHTFRAKNQQRFAANISEIDQEGHGSSFAANPNYSTSQHNTASLAASTAVLTDTDDISTQFAETLRQNQNKAFSFKETEEVQWTKMNVLGKGSFGMVYEGITSDGKMLAVKVQEIPVNEDAEEAKALQMEINLMRTLKHKNIVAYYGCQTKMAPNGMRQMEIFIELCHGGSLATLRKKFEKAKEPFTMSLVRSYTRQVLEGLNYLHGCKVMHRDIKSDNVLISAMGEAKLADFGCSKRIGTTTAGAMDAPAGANKAMYQTMVGSPFFMAPEVMSDDGGGYSMSADVWSVGCLVLELLGREPWTTTSTNVFQVIYQISQAKTMPTGVPENCPPVILDFFRCCFNRDPNKRSTAAQLLKHEWITCPDSALEEVPPP